MSIAEVIRCMPGDPAFEQFKKVPFNIYAPGSLRLQLPDTVNLHFLYTCLVVVKNDMAVARLAIYFNPHIQHREEKIMLLGNFECIDDVAVCGLLMQSAEDIVHDEGGRYIMGPMNGSTWEEYRVALTPVKDPFFTDSISHDWYSRLLAESGFSILERYYSDISDVRRGFSIDESHAAYLREEGIAIRTIDIDRFEEELSAVYMLSSFAFAENVFFSPTSRIDFINKYTAVKPYLDADFVFLAEKEGDLVAFLLCYPDVFCKPEKRLIVKTMAKDPECKTRGIIDMMIQMMQVKAAEKGYDKLIHAFIHQQNKSRQISGRYDGVLFREYALMIKELQQ